MLRRKRQLAVKIEDIAGTPVNLVSADAKLLIIDPQFNANIDLYERNPVRSSLSKLGKLSGKRSAGINFNLELRGSGTATTAPEWSKLLRACGFKQSALKRLTIGTVTNGPFLHGETITQATTSATGRVVMKTVTGTTTLYFVDTGGGTWNGTNVITGQTSGATATPSAVANAGIEWIPVSDEISQVSIGAITNGPFTAGMLITGATSGAKGYVYEDTATGASVLKYYIISGSFQSGESIAGTGAPAPTTTSSSGTTQAENPTVTMALFSDGLKKLVKGAKGKVKFNLKAGEPAIMNFEFMGVYGGVTDNAMLSGITHESSIPPVFLNAQLNIEDYSAIASKIEIDCNNTLSARESVNSAEGILSYRITDREISGSIDPEMTPVATQDFYGNLVANMTRILDFTLGSVAGNKFRIYCPKIQFSSIGDDEREGIDVAGLNFNLIGNNGDDEITILQL